MPIKQSHVIRTRPGLPAEFFRSIMPLLVTYRFLWNQRIHPPCLYRTFVTTTRRCNAPEPKKVEAVETNPAVKNDQPLPPLNRPLGVKQRPTTMERTRTEKMKDLLDQEARMAQRRHL